MKRVRNYRSRFIAPLVAGALVITPLGLSTIPASAEEADDAVSTQEVDVLTPQAPQTSDEASQDATDVSVQDEQAPATESADDQEEPAPDAPAAPAAPADVPAASPATLADTDGVELLAAETDTIAEARAKLGQTVTVRGIVTAAYPTGNFRGIVIQTPGTGGDTKTAGTSDAIFVYHNTKALTASIGDHVEVTGKVGEFYDLTQIDIGASGATLEVLADAAAPVTPVTMAWPKTDAEREAYESMLFMPTGDYTVSNTYSTHQYGEVGLAFGDTPLMQPTELARAGSPEAAAIAQDNSERAVILDDGATTNFLSAANQVQVPPYVSLTDPVRVGAKATFTEPVIIDYRNSAWKLNPTSQVLPGQEPASFENTRTAAPSADNIGAADVTVAAFNVLNYFTTTGADWASSGKGTCTFYKDRAGKNITNNQCTNNGPRGAADAANLKRQQDKIVAAINKLDTSVVGLMEIENSAALGESADEAVGTLVSALNTAAGSTKWAYVGSSTDLPAVGLQDVISNAIIYQPAQVTPLGESKALGNLSAASDVFGNAREPLGQAFVPADGGKPFFAAVNHFKSKGSGVDDGTGQGNANPDRVAQAKALVKWIPEVLAEVSEETEMPVEDVALLGDFNAYSQEDPMQEFYAAGYTNAADKFVPNKETYSFSGLSGSLDHVLYNNAMAKRVTGADIWNINAPESIALEYSRYNVNGKLFHAADAYRSSDHDPVIVGLKKGLDPKFKEFNLLGINDFHGRIDNNTVAFAGTVEESRAQYPDSTIFMSAGDNIGASLFASAVQRDKPTIDVLNALDLKASAVGNHEFDSGYDNLTGDVTDWSDFAYLGANVYKKGTTTPALDEYELVTVDGVTFGLIGVVTEETPTLVTPGGIANLDFGDPVDAVNRVAEKLSDGNPANGEADVIVALYHEGAGSGEPDGSTLEQEIADSAVFKKIVVESAVEVDVIFTGHTHKQYAWLDEVPNPDRPIIQTGNYGEFIGQSVLTVDTTDNTVVNATALNIPRSTTDKASLIADFPRVAEVNVITEAALAHAAVEGNVPVGTITADITTAFTDASFVDGFWTENEGGGKRDDRGSPSTLSNLVANSLRDSLSDELRGGADFGVVNPGGLRADLLYAKSGAETEDGIVTFAEANAVLPFVNNLWTTGLTGAQVKTMLEQQWQRDSKGDVPSRSYLQLGLSDNVTYTFDATREEGDRITSITINGAPIDLNHTYIVGTFSFLAQGGDNFHAFKDATGTRDSGLIDRDAWVDYLEANKNLSPDFARTGVEVPKVADKVEVGDVVEFPVRSLNLTSLGSPLNTELVATFMKDGKVLGEAVGKFVVSTELDKNADGDTLTTINGETIVKFTVPAGAAGADSLQLVATESGTTVTLAMAVATVDDGGNGDGDGDGGDGDGDGGDDGKTDGDDDTTTGKDKDKGKLPVTGADVLFPAALAVLLLGAGAYAVIQRRRKA